MTICPINRTVIFLLFLFISPFFFSNISFSEDDSEQKTTKPAIRILTPNEAALERRRIILQEWENKDKKSKTNETLSSRIRLIQKKKASVRQRRIPEENVALSTNQDKKESQEHIETEGIKGQSPEFKVAQGQRRYRNILTRTNQERESDFRQYQQLFGREIAGVLIKLEQEQEKTWNQFLENKK